MIAMIKTVARSFLAVMLALSLAPAAAPLAAQGVETIDPNNAIDADLIGPDDGYPEDPATTPSYDQPTYSQPATPQPTTSPTPSIEAQGVVDAWEQPGPDSVSSPDYLPPEYASPTPEAAAPQVAEAESTTYKKDDLIGAAEGVFGKGAEGLAGMIEDLLRDQGEPNGYIVGREGGGALVIGVRYGSGTLFHKIEGQKPVYWTGPSIGFDAGANAGSTFVLVYNLFDTEDLYKRFPAAEGQAYLVGGFNASYMRRGDVVLIPIRAGAGLRLGVNAGYMKFSKKQRWLPF